MAVIERKFEEETKLKSQLKLHRIYVKSSLFEASTLTPTLLENIPQPIINLRVFNKTHHQENNTYEVVLSLDLTAKHNDSLLWRVQLQQAALYTLDDFTEGQKDPVLNGFCPNQLYPYACVEVGHIVTQGGFAPVYLSPMNFEQVYLEKQQAAKKNEGLVDVV